jgi:flagellar motility protein MotE (MotC chaperone)
MMVMGGEEPVPEEESVGETSLAVDHQAPPGHDNADTAGSHKVEAAPAAEAPSAESHAQPEVDLSALDTASEEMEFAFDESDPEFLAEIQSQLDFLDVDPYAEEMEQMEEAEGGMSKKDSAAAADWLKTEKAQLATRKADLDKREKQLNALSKKVEQQMLVIEQAESTRIQQLAKLYDGMDPRAVAQLMANLEDDIIVSILPRMKQKNAAQVLQLLPSKRGARLSRKLITIAEGD